jgi:small subunit ribosomal protein S1
VSLVDYGAFVELEEGVEGLVHVSEMSWTKKVVNPSKVVNVGDEVDAIVSELDMGSRRISLSLRQVEMNPWEDLANSFPVGTIIDGTVRNLTEFGAFVEITEEIDGLIHVSDMSWTKRIKHPSEVLNKGDEVRARITSIDVSNQRVSLSIKEFLPNEWQDFVDGHMVGDTVEGRVVNITDFGLFVDIYEGLEGLAHVSEIDVPGSGRLEDHYVVGAWVRARILRIDEDEHKVGLTMRGVAPLTRDESEELENEFQAKHGAPAPVAGEAGETADDGADAVEAAPAEAEAAPAESDTAPAETEASSAEAEAEAAPAEAEVTAEDAAEQASDADASAEEVQASAEVADGDEAQDTAEAAEEAADEEATDEKE